MTLEKGRDHQDHGPLKGEKFSDHSSTIKANSKITPTWVITWQCTSVSRYVIINGIPLIVREPSLNFLLSYQKSFTKIIEVYTWARIYITIAINCFTCALYHDIFKIYSSVSHNLNVLNMVQSMWYLMFIWYFSDIYIHTHHTVKVKVKFSVHDEFPKYHHLCLLYLKSNILLILFILVFFMMPQISCTSTLRIEISDVWLCDFRWKENCSATTLQSQVAMR